MSTMMMNSHKRNDFVFPPPLVLALSSFWSSVPGSTFHSSSSNPPVEFIGLFVVLHTPLVEESFPSQSSFSKHDLYCLHFFEHTVPQSMSGSPASNSLFSHAPGCWHDPRMHVRLVFVLQSSASRHDDPPEHFVVHVPPQSIPVSVPSVILLKHDGPVHILFMQDSAPLQSTFAVHDEFIAHPVHIPPQSIPVSPRSVSVILFLHDIGRDFESIFTVLEVYHVLLSPALSMTDTDSVYELPSVRSSEDLLLSVVSTKSSFPLSILSVPTLHPLFIFDSGEQSTITLLLSSNSL